LWDTFSPKGERGKKRRFWFFSLLSLWERRAGVVRASEGMPLRPLERPLL
jgi:hypothetical protein